MAFNINYRYSEIAGVNATSLTETQLVVDLSYKAAGYRGLLLSEAPLKEFPTTPITVLVGATAYTEVDITAGYPSGTNFCVEYSSNSGVIYLPTTVALGTACTITYKGTGTVASIESKFTTGQIIGVASANAPTGFLLCNGAAINRTSYSFLFAEIGVTYGIGNGTTTFNIPDLQGAFLRGAGTSTGYTTNVTIPLGSKLDDELQGHWHQELLRNANANGLDYYRAAADSTGAAITGASTGFTFNGGVRDPVTGSHGTPRVGTETRVKSVAVNYFIKF